MKKARKYADYKLVELNLASSGIIAEILNDNNAPSWSSNRSQQPCKMLYIGPFTLAKPKIQNTWVFCCTVYTARKTHNIRGFWHEKRMREKTRISYWVFW